MADDDPSDFELALNILESDLTGDATKERLLVKINDPCNEAAISKVRFARSIEKWHKELSEWMLHCHLKVLSNRPTLQQPSKTCHR
jgi:hypothetical protein